MARTLADQLAIEQTAPGQFISKELPRRMGNARPIAYGGCTAAIATRAACATVSDSFALYSLVGHFHGPASTTEKLVCAVHASRDTKTFATRRVVVSQRRPDGQLRPCMELLADFHVEEPALLAFSAAPSIPFAGPGESPTVRELADQAVSQGLCGKDEAEELATMFSKMENFFDTRTCREGVSGQNLMGLLKSQPTDQDHLPPTERSSGDWAKAKGALASAGERNAALAFLMDGGLSFLPLFHNKMWFDDAGACSTLDFALRLFTPNVDLTSWHLRERKTIAAGHGRSYSESRLWDEQRNLVACMTQQCILRPSPQGKAKAVL
jgi:acyl-CoA thioesterase II